MSTFLWALTLIGLISSGSMLSFSNGDHLLCCAAAHFLGKKEPTVTAQIETLGMFYTHYIRSRTRGFEPRWAVSVDHIPCKPQFKIQFPYPHSRAMGFSPENEAIPTPGPWGSPPKLKL